MTAMLAEDLPASVRVRVHNNLGSWYHDSLGDPAKGREHLRLAAETAEANATRNFAFLHWRVYARVALEDGQWVEAAGAARHILEAAPSDFERRNLHALLAVAAARLGQTEEAVAHLREAAAPGPERPGSERWFWPYREPAADPLERVKAHPAELLGAVAEDPRVQAILGEPG
jgi:tetratricopeptide (TPR) repeat protein